MNIDPREFIIGELMAEVAHCKLQLAESQERNNQIYIDLYQKLVITKQEEIIKLLLG